MSGLNERARRQIALLAGEDLGEEQVEEARRSIESCPDCRGHWVRVRGCLDVLDRVAKSAELASGESLWPGIEARLRPVTVARRSERRAERFNGWVPALSMAAACIALLIAGQMDGFAPEEISSAEGATFEASLAPSFPQMRAVPVLEHLSGYEMLSNRRATSFEEAFDATGAGAVLPFDAAEGGVFYLYPVPGR